MAFICLCSMMMLQAAVAYWLVQTVQKYEKRSQVAHDMLTRLTDVSADKQRLKVWYAQLLLTGSAPESTRDQLLVKIDKNIHALRRLSTVQAGMLQAAGRVDSSNTELDTLGVLEQNFSNFSQRVLLTLADRQLDNKTEIWNDVLGIFDMANTRDVRVLIASAIKQQSEINRQAEYDENAAIHKSNMVLGIMIALTCAATLLMAWYFARRLKQPLEDLLLSTQRLQDGNLNSRQPVVVPQRSQDEFGRLAQSFNAMALEIHNTRLKDRAKNMLLEAAVQQRTAQLRLANANLKQEDSRRRQLFADLSHELRTPATAILGEAEIALRGNDKVVADYRLSLDNIASTTRQLAKRINELMLLAREQTLVSDVRLATVPLHTVLQETLAQARSIAQGSGVTVLDQPEAEMFEVRTDAAKLLQILMTLYDNSIRYTPEGGEVRTNVSLSESGVVVSITDTGIGLMAHEEPELFRRSFRGEQARRMRSDGAGLGLAIAKTLADALGMTIQLQSQAGGGCRAMLRIPF